METKDIIVIIVIIVAAMVAAGLSVYQYIENIKKENEANKLQLKVIETQEKLILTQKESEKTAIENSLKLENANEHLRLKTEELLESQAKIIELQSESLKNIFGDGFAEVLPQIKNGELKLILKSKSNYNINNILIEIIDYDKMKKCDYEIKSNKYYFPEECFNKNTIKNNVTTLNPNTWVELNFNLKLNFKSYNLIIKQISNNLTTIQYLTITYNEANELHPYFFRLYEISRTNLEYKLLSKSSDNIPDNFWKQNFPYKIDFNIKN